MDECEVSTVANFGTGLHMQIVDCAAFLPASQCERTLSSYAIKILGV